MIERQHVESWKGELATRNIEVSELEDDKYIRIRLGITERFAVEKRTGIVYGIARQKIKRKECFGSILDWRAWEWTFYPYLKSLYNWKKDEKKNTQVRVGRKKRRKRTLRKKDIGITQEYQSKAWPYTEGTRNPAGSTREDVNAMGTGRPTLSLGSPKNDSGKGSANKRKRGNGKTVRNV